MKLTRTMAVVAWAGILGAAAPEMTAGEFLERMEKAESLGPAAILSSDARSLRTESDRVRERYIADLAKQKASGTARHSCPPGDGKPKLSGDELRNYLVKLTPAQKKQPFRLAVYSLMKQKYPCK
ncbi:hypothetical protein [Blastomonas sp.]|uniref:hypothetical protein n=1 Tax=Blastomonas sp. TaxID=1909299 RepID=UPI003592EB9B